MFGFVGRALDPRDPSLELHDLAGVLLVLTFAGLSVWSVVADDHHAFNMLSFGGGAASLIGAIGTAGWLKGRMRPADQQQQEDKTNA